MNERIEKAYSVLPSFGFRSGNFPVAKNSHLSPCADHNPVLKLPPPSSLSPPSLPPSPPLQVFNERIEKAVAVGRSTVARLKGRWRILLRRCESKLEELPRVMGACIALHNFCEQRGEEFDPSWLHDGVEDLIAAKGDDRECPNGMAERDAMMQMMVRAASGPWGPDPMAYAM